MEFSEQERTLLREIQRDAALSLADLSARTGIPQSTLWRRLNELEGAGVIRARVALLDPGRVGAKLCVLAQISLVNHSEACVDGFTDLIRRLPEVLECHSVSGAADYMLKVRTRDVEAYEAFMSHHLLRSGFVREVHSSFVLKEIKSTTELAIG